MKTAVFTIAFLLSTLPLFSQDAVSSPDELEWGDETHGFKISICLLKDATEVNDNVSLRILLKNESAQRQRVLLSAPYSDFDFIITDSSCKKLPLIKEDPSHSQPISTKAFQLGPGEIKVFEINLKDDIYPFDKPGTYKVQVLRVFPVDREHFDTVKSNIATLTVKRR